MRIIVLLLALTTCASVVRAQVQEKKLEDRLLRPDMTLANSAQNKKFTGTGTTAFDQRFPAQSFHLGDERSTKSFRGAGELSVREFETRKFPPAERIADTSAAMPDANSKFETRKSSFNRTAPEDGKVAKTRDYADSRPFLAQGTRQKILSQQNKSLTIDEVRELLNKSK